MTRAITLAALLLALATPAEACHRYSRWAYGWPQTCPSHKAAGAAERRGYGSRIAFSHIMLLGGNTNRTRVVSYHNNDRDSDKPSLSLNQRARPDPPDAPSKDDLARLRAAMEMDR